MHCRLRWILVALLLGATFGAAEDRFAVLEFFGRPNGAFCSAAGPAMKALQRQMEGRAVLLEYDYDAFRYGRQERFWATGVSATYLPLVMVGSGYRTSSGSVNYESVYRSMINQELDRVVVKVIDRETDKVIKEIPPEVLQRLHVRIREAIGLLIDESI